MAGSKSAPRSRRGAPDGYINWESSARWELLQQGDCRGSPLVLDLAGDGVHLSSLGAGVAFDLLGTGDKVNTAWTQDDDALLAIRLERERYDRRRDGALRQRDVRERA